MDRKILEGNVKFTWLAKYASADSAGKLILVSYLLDYVVESFTTDMLIQWYKRMVADDEKEQKQKE